MLDNTQGLQQKMFQYVKLAANFFFYY